MRGLLELREHLSCEGVIRTTGAVRGLLELLSQHLSCEGVIRTTGASEL